MISFTIAIPYDAQKDLLEQWICMKNNSIKHWNSMKLSKLMQFICQVHMLWSISIAYIGVILIKLVIFNKIL